MVLHIVCRFVKWLRDLDPIFCWLISLDAEICCCSVLKFPQSVLWKSSYCQMWYLRILCEDNTKEGRCKKDRAGSALIADRDLENIMTFVFSGFSFILHLAHHLASLSRSRCRYSAAKLIFLLTAHWRKLRLVSLVVTWIWHVIDIDKEK